MSRLSPVTCLDVRVLISDVLKPKDIERYFGFFKWKDHPICLVKIVPAWIPPSIFNPVHKKLKEYGASYKPRERLWEVPLGVRLP